MKKDRKLIAIDYDETFTAMPDLFERFIILAKELGYKVICVTMRYETEGEEVYHYLGQLVDKIYFTGRLAKEEFLAKHGIRPQVWIDDSPFWIYQPALDIPHD